ncbi:peptidase M23-like protein [Dichotomicrobium thermohalophilum]|uniref:Peptidase M23-like protein n=1 Tax=Dichotomicrobium thermohalophilum TaxID=933063 RepID=A0A397Q115_9HYPH|nr:peptidase M23-like protein [Dichotomicrobium thermohalophilum]
MRTGDHETLPQVYLSKLPEERSGALPPETHASVASRLKWIVSTCLVGIAGLCIIAVVVYASMDFERDEGIISSIQKAGISAMQPQPVGKIVQDQPEIAFGQKTDRIKLTAKGVTTSHIIHDSVVMRRDATEFIEIKPYVLIEASLATELPQGAGDIPKLDPFELYANKTPVGEQSAEAKAREMASNNVALSYSDIRVKRLVMIDDRKIGPERAEQLVAEAAAVLAESGAEFENAPDEPAAETPLVEAAEDDIGPNTTVVRKRPEPAAAPTERFTTTAEKVQSGDTLYAMLSEAGAGDRDAKAIVNAMKSVPGAVQLEAGQELRFTHEKGLPGGGRRAPIRVSLYSGDKHVVSVTQTSTGEYAATRDETQIAAYSDSGERRYSTRASLYKSIFHAAITQDLPHDLIQRFLRTLAYDVDFKQKVSFGDTMRFFFDVEREPSGIEKPGNLLYAEITVDGETHRYYRYRTPNGEVDFYDENGSNSRKFLMRKPVKGARFTSGFGYRRHPILGTRRMHTGADWAAPRGTPILAPGDGTVVFVGRKGGYGKHIRLKHGNGYKTTFSHMQKFAKGIRKGVKVKQGQVIGYIGSTGRSTGPHLHYEVLVNDKFTDPMKIATGSSRQLQGRLLAEFKREKKRIDDLMRRAPVKTQVAAVNE